jgi:cytoskeleton protein RodZ
MSDADVPGEEGLPPSPGTLLKRKREQHGLSEQQVAEHLNLDATAVMAIERDQLDVLGAPVFVKGHLRHYAALVGLPDSEIRHSYEHANIGPAQPTLVPRSRVEMGPTPGRARRPWVVGSLLLILLAVAAAAYFSEPRQSWPGLGLFGIESPARVDSQPTRLAALSGSPTSGGGDLEATGFASSGGSAVASVGRPADVPGDHVDNVSPPAATEDEVASAGQVRLQLEFDADAWVEIYDRSGQAVVYDLGEGGSRRAVSAEAPLSITVGNAGAVTLLVNGKPTNIPSPATGQTVSRFSIGPDGAVR